jgi:hypothetical protein
LKDKTCQSASDIRVMLLAKISAMNQHSVIDRGKTREYLKPALKVAAHLPEGMDAIEASNAFLRWLYDEPPASADAPILKLATAVESERSCQEPN